MIIDWPSVFSVSGQTHTIWICIICIDSCWIKPLSPAVCITLSWRVLSSWGIEMVCDLLCCYLHHWHSRKPNKTLPGLWCSMRRCSFAFQQLLRVHDTKRLWNLLRLLEPIGTEWRSRFHSVALFRHPILSRLGWPTVVLRVHWTRSWSNMPWMILSLGELIPATVVVYKPWTVNGDLKLYMQWNLFAKPIVHPTIELYANIVGVTQRLFIHVYSHYQLLSLVIGH